MRNIFTGSTKIEVSYEAFTDKEAREIREALRLVGAFELLIYAVGKWDTLKIGPVEARALDRVEIDWDTLDSRKTWKLLDIRNFTASTSRRWVEARFLQQDLAPKYVIRAAIYGGVTTGLIQDS